LRPLVTFAEHILVGEGVITMCVVLDQSTVIFPKKRRGITICVVLDQNHGNVMSQKNRQVPFSGASFENQEPV
jgi:hypothetical protein